MWISSSMMGTLLGIFFLLHFNHFVPAFGGTSQLWGNSGELWTGPSGRISDFSFVGYHSGNDPIPLVDDGGAEWVNVMDYGAVGDGSQSDSTAIQAALDFTQQVPASQQRYIIYFPAGTYMMDYPIYISRGNVTLHGDGMGSSTLRPMGSLFDIFGQGPCNAGTNKGYGWCHGFVELDSGSPPSGALASLIQAESRGSNTITVDSTSELQVGMEVRLNMRDDGSQSMYRYLLGGLSPADSRTITIDRWSAVIDALPGGGIVSLDRPLPFDVDLNWSPELRSAVFPVEELGVQELTVEMDSTPGYPGHHKGSGYNAIELTQCHQCWIRNVEVMNADLAVNLRRASHCTVQGLRIRNTRENDPSGLCGHHGVDTTGSSNILLTELFFRDAAFVHDITVDKSFQVVTTRSHFSVLSMDHHGNAPFTNLFDNLFTFSGDRLYNSGGSSSAMPHSGRDEVIWNIREYEQESGSVPPSTLPSDVWVGFTITPFSGANEANDEYFTETDVSLPLSPESLYAAQVSMRMPEIPLPGPLPLAGEQDGPCRPAFEDPDPNCTTGVLDGGEDACCPSSDCTFCGGSGCGGQPGGADACCSGPVLSSGRSCHLYPPPCIMDMPVNQTPLPPCDEGLNCTFYGLCIGPEETSDNQMSVGARMAMSFLLDAFHWCLASML